MFLSVLIRLVEYEPGRLNAEVEGNGLTLEVAQIMLAFLNQSLADVKAKLALMGDLWNKEQRNGYSPD